MDGNNMNNENQYDYDANTENMGMNSDSQGYYDSYDTNTEIYGGKNIQGMIGMILGIVGCVYSVCCCFGGMNSFPKIGLGVAAVVLGSIGKKKTDKPQGMANAALVLGIIVLVLAVLGFIGSLISGASQFIVSILESTISNPQITQMIEDMMNY